jgi:hypothetical protein
MRAVVALANPATEEMMDFHVTMLGRPTAIVFSDLEEANEFASAVTDAWSPAGYVGAVVSLEADTSEGAVEQLLAMWPDYGKNVFLDSDHPAAAEALNFLRAGGKLQGPSV